MSDQNIMAALQERLRTFAVAKSLKVAFEGDSFKPDATKTHLADFLLPSPTDNPSMGRRHKRYEGIYQVDVDAPTSYGAGSLHILANEVAAHFPRGLDLTHSSGQVVLIIRDPSISPLLPDGGRMKRAVSVRYQSDVIS